MSSSEAQRGPVSPATFLITPLPSLSFDLAARRGGEGYTSAGRYMGPRSFGHTGYTGDTWRDWRGGGDVGGARMSDKSG